MNIPFGYLPICCIRMVIGECAFDKSRMRTFKEAVDLSDDCVTACSYSDLHAGRVKAQAN